LEDEPEAGILYTQSLSMSQECAGDEAVPDPAEVAAYNLAALLAFREFERCRKVDIFVDDSIILIQLKECGLDIMNDLHSRSTHQTRQRSICILLGDLIPVNLEKDEMTKE
jgi:hypothetical protein